MYMAMSGHAPFHEACKRFAVLTVDSFCHLAFQAASCPIFIVLAHEPASSDLAMPHQFPVFNTYLLSYFSAHPLWNRLEGVNAT